MGYCAVGRKYGVSDNAIRKWLRWYEYEREAEESEVREASAEDPPDTIAA
jgi:transposase-like protein